MMNLIKKLVVSIFVLSVLFSMQSCVTLIGGGVGAIKKKADTKKGSIPLVDKPGWIQPDDKKYRLELLMDDGKIVVGTYLNTELLDKVELVSLDAEEGRVQYITSRIRNTKIYPPVTKPVRNGFLVGGAIDIASIIAFLLSDEPLFDWEFDFGF